MEKADKVKNALQWYDKNKDLYERCAKTKMDIITQILKARIFHIIVSHIE